MTSYRHRGGQGRMGNWPGRGSIGQPTSGTLTDSGKHRPSTSIIPDSSTDEKVIAEEEALRDREVK